MKYNPYPFQKKMIDEVSENLKQDKNVLAQLPTRGGKSVILCHFAELGYSHNKPVLIIAHTEILISQISSDLVESGIPHGIIKAGHYESRDIIQVASIQTLHKRKHKIDKDHFKLCIWDETHRIKAKTFLEVREYFSSKWLGLSATPIRATSGGGFEDVFDVMVHGPTKRELIKMGFLVPTLVASPLPDMLSGLEKRGDDYTKSSMEKALKEKFIHGEYVEHYLKYGIKKNGEKMKGLVFVPTVLFAKEVADNFNSSGISSVEISSKDNKQIRAEKLAAYYDGTYTLLVSIGLFLEGFTVKECQIIISLRPTMSPIVWLQMAGRGSMVCEGKDSLILVDCTNSMFQLFHPDQDFPWQLQGETKEEKIQRQAFLSEKLVRCDSCCWSYDTVTAGRDLEGNIICPRCGELKKVKGKTLKMIDGSLALISVEDYEKYELQKRWEIEEEYIKDQKEQQEKAVKKKEVQNAKTFEELLEIGKSRGYEYPEQWARHRLAGKAQARQKYNKSAPGNPAAAKPVAGSVPVF